MPKLVIEWPVGMKNEDSSSRNFWIIHWQAAIEKIKGFTDRVRSVLYVTWIITRVMHLILCTSANQRSSFKHHVNNPYEIFIIKLETFDQDLRELCHLLEVDNKELGILGRGRTLTGSIPESFWDVRETLIRKSATFWLKLNMTQTWNNNLWEIIEIFMQRPLKE